MALTFQDCWTKARFLSGDTTDASLVQFKQDINVGYARFDAAISRYFTRKQQFTDIVAGQQYYQVPIDSIRVLAVTAKQSNSYQYPLEEVEQEKTWRQMNIVQVNGNLITNYFVLGNDQIGLYPIPSQNVSQGLRFVYQQQDVFFTQDDYVTGTISINNGATTVTGVGTSWTSNLVGQQFQTTASGDGNWYEVSAVNSTTSITLKTPYVGTSVSRAAYRIGQVFIFPLEYDDVPVDYALSRFFEARNNEQRAQYHKNRFDEAVSDAISRYSSSSTSHVITEDQIYYNAWFLPVVPGT